MCQDVLMVRRGSSVPMPLITQKLSLDLPIDHFKPNRALTKKTLDHRKVSSQQSVTIGNGAGNCRDQGVGLGGIIWHMALRAF